MNDDDMLAAMLDFEDATPTSAPPPLARPPVAASRLGPSPTGHAGPLSASPQLGGPSPVPTMSPSAASSRPSPSPASRASPSLSPAAAHAGGVVLSMDQQITMYYRIFQLLHTADTVPARRERLAHIVARLQGGLARMTPAERTTAMVAAKEQVKALYSGTKMYEQVRDSVVQKHTAVVQAAAQQTQHAAARATPPPGRSPTPAQQQAAQQAAAQQHAQQQAAQQAAAARAQAAASPALQQHMQLQQQQQQQRAALAASLGAAAPKRAAGAPADQPAAKRGRPPGPAGARRRDDDVGVTVDGLIDFDRETDELMEGLQRARGEQRVAARTQSNQQFLSEWRVGNEFYRAIQRTGGGLRVKGECFELVQLAFQAHLSGVVARALRAAQHRQDAARRAPDTVATSDPRRGVAQIERREKAKAEARLEAERAVLLRMAGSKRADEETKERAQKAKAELVGKAAATAANAAVAATLGGAKGTTNKWAKWAAAGPGEGEAGGRGAPAAGGRGKKGGGRGGGRGKKGGAAAADSGEAGGSAAASDASGGTPASSKPAAPAARGLMPGAPSTAGDDASTVHLRDVIATLERDPMYRSSNLLYRLYNTPRAGASTVAAQP